MRIQLHDATARLSCGSLATVLSCNTGAVMLHVRTEVNEAVGHRMYLTPSEAESLGHYLIACAEHARNEDARRRTAGGGN